MVKLFLVFVVLICATTTATPTTARTTTTNANGSSLSTFLTSLNQALENLVDMFQRKVKMDFLDKADKDWIFRIIWKLTCETKKYKKNYRNSVQISSINKLWKTMQGPNWSRFEWMGTRGTLSSMASGYLKANDWYQIIWKYTICKIVTKIWSKIKTTKMHQQIRWLTGAVVL